MSVQRTYYCDGPHNPDIPDEHDDAQSTENRCPHHVSAALIDPEYLPGGFIKVTQHVQGSQVDERHYCSWDCLLRYAANIPPVEYIA